jgi:hypothetical protein
MSQLHPLFQEILKAHGAPASADTHPKGGDVQQAPASLSGAVGEAETPKGCGPNSTIGDQIG